MVCSDLLLNPLGMTVRAYTLADSRGSCEYGLAEFCNVSWGLYLLPEQTWHPSVLSA